MEHGNFHPYKISTWTCYVQVVSTVSVASSRCLKYKMHSILVVFNRVCNYHINEATYVKTLTMIIRCVHSLKKYIGGEKKMCPSSYLPYSLEPAVSLSSVCSEVYRNTYRTCFCHLSTTSFHTMGKGIVVVSWGKIQNMGI